MTALTPAEKMIRYRAKKAEDGLVKVEVWVRPIDVPLAKALEYASQAKDKITVSTSGILIGTKREGIEDE